MERNSGPTQVVRTSVVMRYNPFQTFNQRVAASTLGAAFCSHTLHALDGFCFRLSGGRHSVTSLMTGLPLVMVTCRGAKSGIERTAPLLAIKDPVDSSRFALIATNWGRTNYPAWYHNLKAHPKATCAIAGKVGHYIAHEAVGDEYSWFWGYAAGTYVGYPRYKERISSRRIPVMVMTPID